VFTEQASVCVVLAAPGYPLSPHTGDVIEGLDESATMEGVEIFAAGVAKDTQGRLVTGGGRVLGVTALGASLDEARKRAYQAADQIDWPGIQFRRDIADRAVARAEGAR
jgi:phosphoribosylamine--glycine ligase